jgi:PAS domain S-box
MNTKPRRAQNHLKKTPHKKANDATTGEPLNVEKFRLAAIVESSADAIFSHDFDGTVLTWNKAAEEIFGYKAREMLGRNISTIFPPDLLSEKDRITELIKQGGHVKNYESDRLRKDGTRFPVSLTASPILNQNGEVTAVSKIARDITQQRLDQELINNQLTEIKSIYQTAPVGLTFIDRNLRYVRINDRLAEINGIPAEAHIGRTIREVLPEWLADTLEPVCQSILATGEPILDLELTGSLAAASGAKRTWVADFYPLTNQAGETIGVNAIVREITESKQTEEIFRSGKKRLSGLIDNLFSFVGLIDPDGTLVYINRAAVDIANLDFRDVVGKKFADTFWWSWSEPVQNQLRAAIERAARGETVRYNTIIKIGVNQYLAVDFQLAPILDDKNRVVQLVSSAIDISERLRLESNLVGASDMSYAGEIVAGLAHEIKNPLTGIRGAIDLIIKRQKPENPDRRILEDVRREILRIDDAVNSLLDRTRLRLMCLTETSLKETIRHAVQLAEHQIAVRRLKNRIKIRLDLPPDSFVMPHDAGQLEDAVLNLLINAIDAIGEKTGLIYVSLFKTKNALGSAEAVIEVTDTGAGIPQSDLTKLFTPFHTTKERGTGLGLFAVKRVATAHGGSCSVKSAVGQGTSFAIHLPFDFHG